MPFKSGCVPGVVSRERYALSYAYAHTWGCVGICARMPAMISTFYVGSAYVAVCLAKVAYVKGVSWNILCICVHLGGYAYGLYDNLL